MCIRDRADTIAGVILVHTVSALPYCATIMEGVTATCGAVHEEQAQVLGASPLRAFIYAALPQLKSGILASLSMAFIISYSQYFTTLIIGGGRIKTLSLIHIFYGRRDGSLPCGDRQHAAHLLGRDER